jgi:hypothetical protein
MKSTDIQLHLAEYFPKVVQRYYPSLLSKFSTAVLLTSFTTVGSTVRVVTASPHGYTTGRKVVIVNAFNAIQINSIIRTNGFVTVTTDKPHFLNINKTKYVKIDGCTPTEYNGSFVLYDVVDDFTFVYKITTTPTVATVNGQLLTQDFDNYNGIKAITVIDTNTFTYELKYSNTTLGGSPILVESNVFVHISMDRFMRWLNGRSNVENSINIIINSVVNSNDGIEFTDTNQLERLSDSQPIQQKTEFSLVISFATQEEKIAYATKDLALNEFAWLLEKSLCNTKFASVYSSGSNCRTVLTSHDGIDDESGKRYIHTYNFASLDYVSYQDKFEEDNGVPFEEISLTFENLDNTILATVTDDM